MSVQGLEFDKPTLVDGGHEQKAIVNTASGKQPVNAPTVEDIKRIAKGEAEESSATEWEKSVKNYVIYNATTDSVIINTLFGVDGDMVCTQKVSAVEGIATNTLYDFDDTSVDILDLMDGNRVFRHMLSVEIEINGDVRYLSFGITTSSPTEIDSGDALEENYDACHFAPGTIYNPDDYTTQVVIICEVESIYFNAYLTDGTLIGASVITVEDVVTQC